MTPLLDDVPDPRVRWTGELHAAWLLSPPEWLDLEGGPVLGRVLRTATRKVPYRGQAKKSGQKKPGHSWDQPLCLVAVVGEDEPRWVSSERRRTVAS